MSLLTPITLIRSWRTLLCLCSLFSAVLPTPAQASFSLRVMASNITGGAQKYEAPQIRILQGLKPDIVAIQEFNYRESSAADIRQFVDTAFGPAFSYYREPYTNNGDIPNGIISRWPIVANGSWNDPVLSNRGFAWAQVDLPGSNDLYVVSVHLYNGGTAADRNTEALSIKSQIEADFPSEAWVVVAGDMNTSSRTEAAITTFKTFLSDAPVPTDAVSAGNDDTNLNRNKPYDYILPSFSLTNMLTNVVFASHSFPNGLVFDSRVYTPLSDVTPIQLNDSAQGQHMAILKDFFVNEGGTNPAPAAPEILDQPDSLAVTEGSLATFLVSATGRPPLAYQWLFNAAPIATATNTSFTRVSAQLTDAGHYSVVVSNNVGSVTSIVATLTVYPPVSGTSNVIAQWDFNDQTLSPSVGSGSVSYVGGTAANSGGEFATGSASDPTGGDNKAWNTSSYPDQAAGNKSAGVQFNVNTVGRSNISVAWDSRASNTGSKYGRLQYSTNGTTFMDIPDSAVNSTSFGTQTNDLAGLAGVEDNANFAIRIVSEFESTASGSGTAGYVASNSGSAYSPTGTLRFDMVTIYGSPSFVSPTLSPLLTKPTYSEGQFQFQLTGKVGVDYVIQTSTNLADTNWIPVWTNASPFLYTETNSATEPALFYRAKPQI